MIDLHSHLLPGLDDGATDDSVALDMARAFVADGVEVVACTPHILPGLYLNSGPAIRSAVAQMQARLERAEIPLRLIAGADNHIIPDFVAQLRSGHLLSLNDTRYVLVEPPHHVAPARMEELFFSIQVAGYVPVLTHPERLTWIRHSYSMIERLAQSGVFMQITAGSLTGRFGREPRYWAERLLDEGRVHILATDAHDVRRRPPDLARGREVASERVGEEEAHNLVFVRPMGMLSNRAPADLPAPRGRSGGHNETSAYAPHDPSARALLSRQPDRSGSGFSDRLRRFFVR